MVAEQDIPEAVGIAVNSVMAGIKGLFKKEKNQDAGYRFASIDDFLASVNPLWRCPSGALHCGKTCRIFALEIMTAAYSARIFPLPSNQSTRHLQMLIRFY